MICQHVSTKRGARLSYVYFIGESLNIMKTDQRRLLRALKKLVHEAWTNFPSVITYFSVDCDHSKDAEHTVKKLSHALQKYNVCLFPHRDENAFSHTI